MEITPIPYIPPIALRWQDVPQRVFFIEGQLSQQNIAPERALAECESIAVALRNKVQGHMNSWSPYLIREFGNNLTKLDLVLQAAADSLIKDEKPDLCIKHLWQSLTGVRIIWNDLVTQLRVGVQ